MEINITEKVNEILTEYTKDVKRVTNDCIDRVAKESVSKLKEKSSSMFGGGKYSKGWTLKRERGAHGVNDVIVYNKSEPSLTHLLEKSHRIVNGKGEWGRTNPHPHIQPVEEWVQTELPNLIKRELE